MPIDRRAFGQTAAIAAAACAAGDGPAAAQETAVPIKSAAKAAPAGASVVVAFDAAGHLDTGATAWQVPSEIWAYRPQHSTVRKRLIAALFRSQYGLETTPTTQALFDRRINLLLADNLPRLVPSVQLGSARQVYPPTGANGHTQLMARLPVHGAMPVTGARVPIEVAGGVPGRVHLIPPDGLSVICDIDDTVKDSGVLDKRRLWQATFFQPFKAVPGMAALLTRLTGPDGGVHYVSSTPWHLYQPLREWLASDAFPVSSLHLKQIRLKDQTIVDIFRGPEKLKPPVIAGLLRRWPKRRFVLVGDSGEKDPEVYGDMTRRFPLQVARILIRRAPGDTSGPDRFAGAFAGLERSQWQVFDTPEEVTWSP